MQPDLPTLCNSLESLIHHDPGGRGVASYCVDGKFLDAGGLQRAVESLSREARSVGIVTGFCIATADPPAAETDGPPGALMLARVLRCLGVEVTLLSDSYGLPLLATGCQRWGLPTSLLVEIPFENDDPQSIERRSNAREHSPRTLAWIDELLGGPARDWTHLIAIERAGPSHTHEAVPVDERDVCHNMRGVNITAHTAKAHLLFEVIRERGLSITTVGIGDGGNEIGLGCVPWHVLTEAIRVGPGALTACRVPTEHLILAGVSNWGGYALAAALAAVRGQSAVCREITVDDLRELIVALVKDAGAVDGVTRQREASVDGLGLDVCSEIWRQIVELLR